MSRTKDKQIHHLLESALQMMTEKMQDRLLAFDAALDLKEFTRPQTDISSYEQYCQRVVRGQGLGYRFSSRYKPITRAISSSRPENRDFRSTPVKHSRRVGWAGVPTSTHYAHDRSFTNMPPSFDTEQFCGRGTESENIKSLFTRNETVSLQELSTICGPNEAYVFPTGRLFSEIL